ncbi:MAG TPA: phosphoribosyltransferase family protein [Natronosporangium sp.]|nr:phosphoribosyltransferase family protein [Natronosporangium sp.]
MDTAYRDRTAAGEVLAEHLTPYAGRPDVTVLGLVRGGVPVAAVVAERLDAPLDVLVVRKLGVPSAPELAFGAIGPGGVMVRNEAIADLLTPAEIEAVRQSAEAELTQREQRYRPNRPALSLVGRVAIVVDDGLATGATARAAVEVARHLGASRVVMAAPVGAPEALARLREVADEVVCPLAPPDFGAVSRYYQRFTQVDDDEVVALLSRG